MGTVGMEAIDRLLADLDLLTKDLRELRAALSGVPEIARAPSTPATSATTPVARVREAVSALRVITPGSYAPGETIAEMVERERAVRVSQVAVQQFMEKPWTGHKFVVAPQDITSDGATFSLGRTVDYVMVMPTVDAYIEFDTGVSDSTPPVPGGTLFAWNMQVSTISYKALSDTLKGKLYIWAAWW
jgi:hypothetical protein